ncbi:MAG: YtxH domain-containing protein [Anaerolineaceae bacterium]|nr:YtxH domain-containing protein [Anaerolineaceae bacterium]
MSQKRISEVRTSQRESGQEQLSGFLAGFLFVGGLLLGSVAGAGVMLLMAPQSGKKTRKQLLRKGQKVRKQTAKTVKHKVEQVQDKANQVSTSIHEQVEDLQERVQDALGDQKDRWGPVIEAGKTAVHKA